MNLKKWKSLFRPLAITAACVLSCAACTGHDDEEQVAPDSANSEGGEQNAAGADADAAANGADTASEAKAPAEGGDAASEAKAPAEGGDAEGAATASADTPNAEGATAALSNGVASADNVDGAETGGATMASDAVASSEAAPAAAQAAAPAAQDPAPAAQAAAPTAPAAAGSSRVVRYIQADQTNLYAAANDGAPVTRSVDQGDILMVVEENGWGRITDNLFVKLDSVASRAVPRSFTIPEWQAPAH